MPPTSYGTAYILNVVGHYKLHLSFGELLKREKQIKEKRN
jgi:hypothetical protein